MATVSKKAAKFRLSDIFYDPTYTVSGPADAVKVAMLAKLQAAKFQVCPVFANMFSDLPQYPSKQLIRRHSASKIPVCMRSLGEPTAHQVRMRKIDVCGTDRAKYFDAPKKKKKAKEDVPKLDVDEEIEIVSPRPKTVAKKTQTKYRESEAQTTLWEPPCIVAEGTDPEILKLDFLKWGEGTSAGMHEVLLIERARMRRAWERYMDRYLQNDIEKRAKIIEQIEDDEFLFREQEIQDLQNIRFELLEQMLNEINQKTIDRSLEKTNSFAANKIKEKEEKLNNLKHKTERELRKVNMKELGIKRSYTKREVINYNVSYISDLYGPQLRFGENPRHWHKTFDKTFRQYRSDFRGVENYNTLPKWLENVEVKLPPHDYEKELCVRWTKWTQPILASLYTELISLRNKADEIQYESLLIKLPTPRSPPDTPVVEAIRNEDEIMFQSVCVLQAFIKGRAAQSLIYEGRDRCRQLIKELKHGHAFLQQEKEQIKQNRFKIMTEQRSQATEKEKMMKLQENLRRLQGSVVGSLLDFLNKELRRLVEERRIHAMCLLFERDRAKREATESGRRQQELRRRREHDEMFKQILKIDQESVDVYLENIITEGIEMASETEAKQYVTKLAHKIEEEVYKNEQTCSEMNIDEGEEMISNLVHQFMVPEANRRVIRDQIKAKQKENLKGVHDLLYHQSRKIERDPLEARRRLDSNYGESSVNPNCNCVDKCQCECFGKL